jgi:nitrite reductase/ring-hydroxylating ferredoxin subunit
VEGHEIRLLALDELDDPGARGCQVGTGPWPLDLFVVRRGGSIWGYVNRCPHAGHPLNWLPDKFLTRDRSLIQCASHGARFEIESGLCVLGPCPGRSLTSIPLQIRGPDIVVQRQVVAQLTPTMPADSSN